MTYYSKILITTYDYSIMDKDELRKLLENRGLFSGLSRDYELEIVKRIVSIEKKLDYLIKKVEDLEKEIKK